MSATEYLSNLRVRHANYPHFLRCYFISVVGAITFALIISVVCMYRLSRQFVRFYQLAFDAD